MPTLRLRFLSFVTLLAMTIQSQSAQVDYGLTLGSFLNNQSTNSGGLFQLGIFSGYSDSDGAAFFDGKDYATLQASWQPFAGSDVTTDPLGQFYQSVDLLNTPVNTRLFVWGYSDSTPSGTANWAVISGAINGSTIYDTVWLAPSPSDIGVNVIELGVTSNQIYSGNNPAHSLVANSGAPSERSADLSVFSFSEATLTTGGTPLNPFTTYSGVASAPQSFTFAGAALTGNVRVSAPAELELSANNGTSFAPSLDLTPSSGTLASQTIQVRISSSAPTGPVSGDIVISSQGAAPQNIAVNGTVVAVTVPVILSPGTATATRGTPFSYQITAAGTPILEYILTGTLPAGLTFNKPNGRITGTPTAAAVNRTVVLAARNVIGRSQNFNLAITVANPPAPLITGVSTAVTPFAAYNGLPAPALSVSVDNPQNHPLRYQWRLNGRNIVGATKATYAIAKASAAAVGSYDVVVSNFVGMNATSPALAFTLRPAATFSVDGPRNQTIATGDQAQFSARITDSPPGSTLSYQWFRNGEAIAGATGPSYSLPNGVSAATAGAYTLTVTSRVGTTVVGSVSTAPWFVALDDSGILVYRIITTTGAGFNTTGPREVATKLSGYLIIDRKNGNAAIVETYGVAANRRNRLQLRDDVAAYSTGPVAGSRTVFAGSVNGGNDRVDHDILWLVGADAFLTVAPARTTAPVTPAVTLLAPSSLKGFIGTIGSQPEFGIDNYEVTLAIDNVLTSQAYRAGDSLEQTIVKVRAAATQAGFPNE